MTLAVFSVSRSGRASGAFELGVVPKTLGAPALTYPGAYSGLGLDAQLDYYVNGTDFGIIAGVLSQGTGKLETIRGRYYFYGHAQTAHMDSTAKVSSVLVTETKSRGLYVEFGAVSFQLSKITAATSTAPSFQVSTLDFGAVAALGLEQPLLWGTFLGIKANLFNSLGSTSLNMIAFEVAIGLPVAF